MKIKDCKGCHSEQYTKECRVLRLHIKQKSTIVENLSMCPCSVCIIKVMCSKICRQHEKYIINLINLYIRQEMIDENKGL